MPQNLGHASGKSSEHATGSRGDGIRRHPPRVRSDVTGIPATPPTNIHSITAGPSNTMFYRVQRE
jgi:hypothetical protein